MQNNQNDRRQDQGQQHGPDQGQMPNRNRSDVQEMPEQDKGAGPTNGTKESGRNTAGGKQTATDQNIDERRDQDDQSGKNQDQTDTRIDDV